jgi:hypothetical protein
MNKSTRVDEKQAVIGKFENVVRETKHKLVRFVHIPRIFANMSAVKSVGKVSIIVLLV